MEEISPEFSYIVDTTRLPSAGQKVSVSANEDARRALAKRLSLEYITSLTVEVLVKPVNKRQVRLTGTVEGVVGQICVVSLQPFESAVKTDFSVLFESEPSDSVLKTEIDLDFSEDEDKDVLSDNKIDVGETAVEYFSLALDPFPRAPDAVFTDRIEPKEKENPFAVLGKLKKS